MVRFISAVTVLGVLVCSCKSGASVVEENRAAAEAKLDAMRAAVTAALEHPLTTPPELPEKLRFDGDAPNAYLVHPEWLAVPPRPPEKSILVPASDFIAVRGVLSGAEAPNGVPEYYTTLFAGFLGVRWLVVVDTASFSGGVATDDSTFAAGGFDGTLHFVDIDTGKSLGALGVDASSSDSVEVVVGDETKHLSSDLWVNAREAIGATLAPLCHNGQSPLP